MLIYNVIIVNYDVMQMRTLKARGRAVGIFLNIPVSSPAGGIPNNAHKAHGCPYDGYNDNFNTVP